MLTKPATPASLAAEIADWNRIGRYEFAWTLAESLGLEPQIEYDEDDFTPCQRAELERRLNSNEPGIPADQVFKELHERLRQRREALERIPPELRPRKAQEVERDAMDLPESDRRALTRQVADSLVDDCWFADEMRALVRLIDASPNG